MKTIKKAIVEEKPHDNMDDFIKDISYKGNLYNEFTKLDEYPFKSKLR